MVIFFNSNKYDEIKYMSFLLFRELGLQKASDTTQGNLMKNFIEAKASNKLLTRVTGKRKREVGLVVPAKFTAFTEELRIAQILERELKSRAKKYTHFELKNIVIEEHKFPLLV